jgi:cell division initiation protein
MNDLTPLDVRKKRGDFAKGLRGYDTNEVDTFLEMVSERMEGLVKENLAFRKKVGKLREKVDVQDGREQAVRDALVTAQELRRDVKKQARREVKVLEHEARARIEGMVAESGRVLAGRRTVLEELERQRERFLKAFRTFLERELDTVEVEFGRAPLEDVTLDLELGKAAWSIGTDEDDESEDDHGEDDDDEGGDGVRDDSTGGDDDRVTEVEADALVANEGELIFVSDSAEDAGIVGPSHERPPARSDSREGMNGVTEDDQGGPTGSLEGGDSLWLSSIMSDREDKDAG